MIDHIVLTFVLMWHFFTQPFPATLLVIGAWAMFSVHAFESTFNTDRPRKD